jgi:uncharacterized protein (DUF1015 family)
MRIDNFVEMYTPIELDKINQRKCERAKPGRKILMGKMFDNIGNYYKVNEKSPNKDVNNDKAVKILHEAFSSQGSFTKCIAAPKRRFIQKKTL